jgi:hypothetical protein
MALKIARAENNSFFCTETMKSQTKLILNVRQDRTKRPKSMLEEKNSNNPPMIISAN